jgi:hypothetical protein
MPLHQTEAQAVLEATNQAVLEEHTCSAGFSITHPSNRHLI